MELQRSITSTEKPQSAIHCISSSLTAMFRINEISSLVYSERYEPAKMEMTGKVKEPH